MLQKKQPKDQGAKLDSLQVQISNLDGQISTILQRMGQTQTPRDITGEILSKLNSMQWQNPPREAPEKRKEKLGYYSLILWSAVTVIVCLLVLSIFETESVKKERDKYQYYSNRKHDNFMKYRYLKLFGNQNTRNDIKNIDKLYPTKPDYYDSLIIKKEVEQKNNK